MVYSRSRESRSKSSKSCKSFRVEKIFRDGVSLVRAGYGRVAGDVGIDNIDALFKTLQHNSVFFARLINQSTTEDPTVNTIRNHQITSHRYTAGEFPACPHPRPSFLEQRMMLNSQFSRGYYSARKYWEGKY